MRRQRYVEVELELGETAQGCHWATRRKHRDDGVVEEHVVLWTQQPVLEPRSNERRWR